MSSCWLFVGLESDKLFRKDFTSKSAKPLSPTARTVWQNGLQIWNIYWLGLTDFKSNDWVWGALQHLQYLVWKCPRLIIQISKTWHKNVSYIQKTYFTICLYGQACYFRQVVYNSFKVSGRERLASFHEFSTILTFHLHQQILDVYDWTVQMENPTCLQ